MSGEFKVYEAEPDRRSSERFIALFRPAIIERDSLKTFCLVRNISSNGLMLSVQAPLLEGQVVSLHFSAGAHLQGRVIWVSRDRAGINFKSKIDVGEFISQLASKTSEGSNYRSPRLEVQCNGEFIIHSQRRKIELLDISQRGFKARVAEDLVEQQGILVVPGLEPRKAVVRWQRQDTAGFYFIDPIGFTELGQWVMNAAQWSEDGPDMLEYAS